jgi:cobalt/nickel transport system permease protein/cobalt/nickel transport protein
MKKTLLTISLIMSLALGGYWVSRRTNSSWDGVDETVVGKYAREAGRPPRKPYINTDQGDLLLFVFLLAGVGGGFVAGYYFRELFPPQQASPRSQRLTAYSKESDRA